MCKKVLINPETESFINDLKREYNNSIVKPYKKTRDVLEILMKKFVLYQKVSIQKMDTCHKSCCYRKAGVFRLCPPQRKTDTSNSGWKSIDGSDSNVSEICRHDSRMGEPPAFDRKRAA